MSVAESPSIALLSSYSGANLGDGAIHDAAIIGLTERIPGVRLSSINLDPAQVSSIHRIPSFPMCAVDIPWYGVDDRALDARSDGSPPGEEEPSGDPRSDNEIALRMRRMLRPLGALARSTGAVWASRHEVAHLRHSRAFVSDLDAIVVTGGGQIDDQWGGAWAHPYSLLRWTVLGRRASVPVLFLSVGVDRMEDPLARRFTYETLRRASYRSFRDPGSKAVLLELGASDADPCVPDLAFSLKCSVRPPRGVPLRIGVSPIAFGRRGYWPGVPESVFSRYLDTLVAFVGILVDRGATPVLFASSEQDESTVRLLAQIVRERQGHQLTIVATKTAKELLDALADMDLAVTSRLHGTILAHISGVPTMTLSFGRKVRSHMDSFGLGQYCAELPSVSLEWMGRALDLLVEQRESLSRHLTTRVEVAREQVDSQFDHVAELIHTRRL